MAARELGQPIMTEIYETLGIRATCGIGTNLYLAKVALDITAKHASDYIGYLDEEGYRKILWDHRPLTDFWRIGAGTANRLGNYGIHTMGEIAGTNEDFLYKLIGIDAELLIDHAWGRVPLRWSETGRLDGIKVASRPKKKMEVAERAKRFLPFAALKGLPEALAEQGRIDFDGKIKQVVDKRVGFKDILEIEMVSEEEKL